MFLANVSAVVPQRNTIFTDERNGQMAFEINEMGVSNCEVIDDKTFLVVFCNYRERELRGASPPEFYRTTIWL